MITGARLLLCLPLFLLGGCGIWPAQPRDPAIQSIPAPPIAARVEAYAQEAGFSLQVRPGDCAKIVCFTYSNGRWRELPKTSLHTLPLLTLGDETGSEYSDASWRAIGRSGQSILLNRKAGEDNVEAGLIDGLRIGLRDADGAVYATAYSVEAGTFLAAQKQCLDNALVRRTDCAPALGNDLYLSRADVQVVLSGDTAWLLHRRGDGSVNLIDLLTVKGRSVPVACLPGLVLVMNSHHAGPVEAALSPNLIVSRRLDPAASARAQLAQCAAAKT